MLHIAIAAKTAEAAGFGAFFKQRDKHYGRGGFVDVISADAGMCPLKNADSTEQASATYVVGRKGDKNYLHGAAILALQDKAHAPEAQTAWEPRSGA